MGKSWIGVFMGVFFCLALATTAFAGSMDTEGESCGDMTCQVHAVAVKTITAVKAVYELKGICGYSGYSSDVACPPNVNVTVTAEWFMGTKVAHEKIFRPLAKSSSVILDSETFSNCPENPWVKAGVVCTVTSGNTKPGEKYPRSAAYLSNAQRQTLATLQPSGATLIPIPAAPVILSPVQNQKFSVIPASVKIEVSHNLNYGVQFEFQSKGIAPRDGGLMEAYKPVKGVTLQNQQTSKGITTGTLVVRNPSQWRIRAMSNFQGAPWSEWRTFTVDKLTLNPSMKMRDNIPRMPLPGK
jgi:hypothetical protein